MDNEQLKLTDFFDPLVQLAIGLSVFADLFFLFIPIRYIFALIVAVILWSGMKGFVTKLIFIIGALLPLPLLTIASVLSILLSNTLIRTIAVQVGIQVVAGLTAGAGEALEVGAVAGEATAVGAEAAGAAAVAESGAGIAAAGEGATAGAEVVTAETGAGIVGEAAEAMPKPIGPSAQPPEMAGPQAQPEEVKRPSLRERAKAKANEKIKEKLAEKLASEDEEREGEPNIIEGEFGNPDVINFGNDYVDNENEDDNGTVDLRNAA